MSIRRLTRDHPTDAATRLRHVSTPSRDEVNMGVHDGLPCDLACVRTDIEALDRTVPREDVLPEFVKEQADGTALGLEEIEVGCRMPT